MKLIRGNKSPISQLIPPAHTISAQNTQQDSHGSEQVSYDPHGAPILYDRPHGIQKTLETCGGQKSEDDLQKAGTFHNKCVDMNSLQKQAQKKPQHMPKPVAPGQEICYSEIAKTTIQKGYIFACTKQTFQECVDRKLFGSPEGDFAKMCRFIDYSTLLFLLDIHTKEMHGVFQATCLPRMNIVAHAWKEVSSRTFPAQVSVRLIKSAKCTVTRMESQGVFSTGFCNRKNTMALLAKMDAMHHCSAQQEIGLEEPSVLENPQQAIELEADEEDFGETFDIRELIKTEPDHTQRKVVLNCANIGHFNSSNSPQFNWDNVRAAFTYYRAARFRNEDIIALLNGHTARRNPIPEDLVAHIEITPIRDGMKDIDDLLTLRAAQEHSCQYVDNGELSLA
jgi:hypothetical protein